MDNEKNISIFLKHRLKNEKEIVVKELTPEEYFDPLNENESCYEVDSTSKHLEPYDYLNIEYSKLDFIEEDIFDKKNNRRLIIRYIFWGENRLSYRQDIANNKEEYTEIILTIMESNKKHTQVIKIGKNTEDIKLITHALVLENGEGGVEDMSLG